MNLNKICPDCGAEYQPHIGKCADCDVLLLSPEECARAQEERKLTEERSVEEWVKLMEGELNWMAELKAVLLDARIPCILSSDSDYRKSCGNTVKLMVSPDNFERSSHAIEEYLMELEPDLRIAKEMFGKGKCPACGASIGNIIRECPDCGLPLIIIEEEE